MRRILILGATSGIARFVGYEYAREGAALYLAGRDKEELQRIAADIHTRFGVPVYTGVFDVLAMDEHFTFFQNVLQTLGRLDGLVLAVGFMGDQHQVKYDPAAAHRVIDTNFTGPVSILTLAADYFEQQKSGFILGISSVAGDRGRQSNYVYGAAKGALSLFLQGLRNRLYRSGVRVITVKPGFVDTRLTFGMKGLLFLASPETIAAGIYRAERKGRDIAYLPPLWFFIMLLIKAIPERMFKKLNI